MTKIERELARLDALDVPPLEREIRERAVGTVEVRLDLPARSAASRIVAGATALLLFAAVSALAWRAFQPADDGRVGVTPAPIADSWAAYAEGWTALPVPPELRVGVSVAWTGHELIVWSGVPSGADGPAADGFAFDPREGTWRRVPAAPRGLQLFGVTPKPVWTGAEVIFYPAGIAFEPAANTWRELPPAPHDPGYRQTAVAWTGSEMIVFGGGEPDSATAHEGAAYDPAADRWRPIADAPIGLNLLSAAWTGDEVLVFGSLLNDRNIADTETSVGAAYDPATDTWRTLPPSELSPQATSAVYSGGRLIAWDYEVHSQAYDPATDAWSEPVEMPMRFSECYPDSVVASDVVFAWFCGQAATFDPQDNEWHRVRGGVLEPTIEANGQEYELFRFASLAGAGDVFAMVAEGITVDADGVPCYGCPGAPLSYWVYRPPS
ncbi:MAG: hypothetical protein ACRDHC_01300 [Actinomycetota bacterium]